MEKGVVIMESMNFQKQHSVIFSQVFLNERKVKGIKNDKLILQNKLGLVADMIFEGFSKMMGFLNGYYFSTHEGVKKSLEEIDISKDIVIEYNSILKNGIPKISTLSKQLEEKEINKKTFELLLHIINYQIETTRGFLDNELSIAYLDAFFTHLRDIPYYLEADLEIDNLPKLKSVENNDFKLGSWKIINQGSTKYMAKGA